MSKDITISKEDGIVRIVLTRAQKKNALTRDMYSRMAEAFLDAEADKTARVILLHGTEGVFTAGNDLADFMGSPEFGPDAPVNLFLKAIMTISVPVIAAVDGPAVGIGTTMLMHFDKVFATRGARFVLPFVDLALVPEAASSLLLPGKIGYTAAADLMLDGRPFTGEEAHGYHIVTDLVDSEDELYAAAEMAARSWAAKPPSIMRATKKLLRGDTTTIFAKMQEEGALFAKALASPEVHEALAAFTERRPPDYSKFEASDD